MRGMIHRIVVQPRASETSGKRPASSWESRSRERRRIQWAQDVRAKIDTLQTNPERCPIDIDSDAYGREVRVLLFGKRRGVYRILFVIESGVAHVLTVRHSARRSLREEME